MKTLSALSLIVVASLGMSAAATAQSVSPSSSRPDASQAALNSTPPVEHRVTSTSDKQLKQGEQTENRNCLRDTGSLIKARKGHCLPVPGNSYSREDLLRTGAPDNARALQMLDPRITVHGH